MADLKRGSPVRYEVPDIEGIVLKRAMHDEEIVCLVEYVAGGEQHQRWFKESELIQNGEVKS